MAKKSGAKPAKSTDKNVVAKKAAAALPAKAKPAAKVVAKSAKAEKAAGKPAAAEAKKVSANLIATIEKRKQEKEAAAKKSGGSMFGRPMGRRGRRPKRPVEYTPTHSDEGGGDGYDSDSPSGYEGFENDTGIRLKEEKGGVEDAYGVERFEDFDEELNFDR